MWSTDDGSTSHSARSQGPDADDFREGVGSDDAADHPRRVLTGNVGYFQRHAHHTNYPTYRARGWPVGSGMTGSGVKQFNKRVKDTEQFWHLHSLEPVLALRSLWLSNDDRWNHHGLGHLNPNHAA